MKKAILWISVAAFVILIAALVYWGLKQEDGMMSSDIDAFIPGRAACNPYDPSIYAPWRSKMSRRDQQTGNWCCNLCRNSGERIVCTDC